ncbi:exodeoxyribonuclease VII large subunit [Candidatus Tenderia electrophaga]|jgi:exodeoxyribonuclease VII large subunit|uniref:Exodeoxyribonuclease 7 large subunit n=1 Tax=Candidatus Tenderia electrophaga TaxID=1748243 RepID=A0A0S2TEN7_9GAMM|nr:exodeoxyribonuclease VII large subunit [Candidatus Tenderia electrophaga]
MQDALNIPGRDIYSVSRLIRETRAVLEGSFPLLWIEGEISNLSRPASGHMYFSLKDEAAQVRCAMFRNRNLQLRFKPENGMRVLVRARVTVYEARGDFQIVVEHMEEAGLGALQRAFEELKARLGREGLFEMQHKQALPVLPKRIGVITSPTGAAIRDILSVLKRRFPAIPILIYPVPVQGAQAAGEIARMIQTADSRRDCDVLILARGGGSLEDLWAFNEEGVARAIYACNTPLIAAVGHEVDFTIADFVADQRAPTPSAAAELVSPDQYELQQRLSRQSGRLQQQIAHVLRQSTQSLDWLNKRLQRQHPARELQLKAQRLDELELRLKRQIKHNLKQNGHRLGRLQSQLQRHAPLQLLSQLDARRQHLQQRLQHAWERSMTQKRQRLAICSRTLDSVSPLATLQRGYAIVQDMPAKHIYRDAAELSQGDRISARLAKGSLICTVDEIHKETS